MQPTQPWCWPCPGWVMERGPPGAPSKLSHSAPVPPRQAACPSQQPSDAYPCYSTCNSRAGGHAAAFSPVWVYLHPYLQQHALLLPLYSTFEPQWLNTVERPPQGGRKPGCLLEVILGGGQAVLCYNAFLIKAHPCIWPQPITMI